METESIELKLKSGQSYSHAPTEDDRSKYPWHLFIRTMVLLNAFLGVFTDVL